MVTKPLASIHTTDMLESIIEVLYKRYPNQLPTEEISDFKLGRLVGNQDVISYIKQYLEKESVRGTKNIQR